MSNPKPIAVVDTDVASYLLKGLPIGFEYCRLLQGYQTSMAFITAGELLFGAARRTLGRRRLLHLDLFLTECPIIPFKVGMERVYAQLMTDRQRIGKPMEKADAWIATVAIYHNVPLVTHDANFAATPGLQIITASKEARAAQVRLPAAGRRPLNLDMRCQCSV
jgi:predicted nucleic acid-binding protein